jgi:hypothetical protein
MKKALLANNISREKDILRVRCILTLETWNDLHACGIANAPREVDVGKSGIVIKIKSDTSIYFQEASGHVSKIHKDALWMKFVSDSFLVAPVLKEAKTDVCAVIYFTPYHPLDQFQ